MHIQVTIAAGNGVGKSFAALVIAKALRDLGAVVTVEDSHPGENTRDVIAHRSVLVMSGERPLLGRVVTVTAVNLVRSQGGQ